MPFFSGFAQGASDALTTMRQEQQRINEANANREQQALLHLTTSPNSDIAATAAAALMHPKPPAGGFLKNLFGQVQDRPEYPTLRGLLESTRGGQGTAGGGSTVPATGEAEPAGAPPATAGTPPGSAALPAGSPVEPGKPAMQMPVSPKVAGSTMGASPSAAPAPAAQAAVPPPAATAPASRAAQGPPAATAAPSSANPLFFTGPQASGLTAQAEMEGKLRALGFTPSAAGLVDPQGKPIDPVFAAHLMGAQVFHTTDANGTVTTFVNGEPVRTAGGGKPSGPQNEVENEIRNYMLENPGTGRAEAETTVRTALQQAIVAKQATAGSRATTAGVTAANAPAKAAAGLAQTRQATATGEARMEALRASAVATLQRTSGTAPISPAQALAAATQMKGNDPSLTVQDVSDLADRIWQSTQGGGTGSAAGTARPSTPPPPGVPPTAPPPPGGRGRGARASVVLPPNVASAQPHTELYSPAGKQTILAVSTLENLLPKIEATLQQGIKDKTITDSNNPIPEKIAKFLYGLGISPGEDKGALQQLVGMSQAYGERGLIGGRANLILQELVGQHLLEQGDSVRLLQEKIAKLKQVLPAVRAAVDQSENMRVGRPGTGGPPPAAKIRARDPQGKLHEADAGTTLPTGWTLER